MTEPRILFVTVNWNGGSKLSDCVLSFLSAEKPEQTQMIVVDNNSSDGSERWVAEAAAQNNSVTLIRSQSNLGFGNACNLGVHHVKASRFDPTHIIFLNPDTRLEADTITKLIGADCMRMPEIGIFGVKQIDDTGIATSCSNFPTALNFWIKYCGLERLFQKWAWAQHHLQGFDHNIPRQVDQVMGAFLCVRAHVFDQLKGFDPRFFVYFEEVDFCLRCKNAGYAVWFEPSSQIWHHGGGTTETAKGFRLYLSLSSRIRYFHKNRNFLNLMSILVLTFGVEPIARSANLIRRGRFKELSDLARGYGLFLKHGVR